jgi:hypothetical protein
MSFLIVHQYNWSATGHTLTTTLFNQTGAVRAGWFESRDSVLQRAVHGMRSSKSKQANEISARMASPVGGEVKKSDGIYHMSCAAGRYVDAVAPLPCRITFSPQGTRK